MTPFHLAFPVHDLEATRAFSGGLLGCKVGRSSETWIDFDFFGHQITAHRVARGSGQPASGPHGPGTLVDGKNVPGPHFGAILGWNQWHQLADRLRSAGIEFIIEPHVRFPGQPGEQATMFLADPSGNCLEFKSFQDSSRVFVSQ